MILRVLRELLARRPVRYVLVGGSAFLLNLGLFMAAVRLLDLDPRLAELGSRFTGALFTFVGHRQWTFAVTGADHRLGLGSQGLSYLALNVLNLALSPWVVWFSIALFGRLGLPDALLAGKLLAEALMLAETWLLTSLIFGRRGRPDVA